MERVRRDLPQSDEMEDMLAILRDRKVEHAMPRQRRCDCNKLEKRFQ
jgi:hypothetical protein